MTPAAAVARAAKKTEDITSLRYRMTGEVPEEGRVSGEAAMSMKPLAMSMKMTAEDQATDGQVEIRLVDKAMYIGGGAQVAKEMDGKSWIKLDMSAMGADKQLNADQLGGGQADKNPATESTFLTGSKDVKKVGTETVDGVKTTHYKGTYRVSDVIAALPKADRAQANKTVDALKRLGGAENRLDDPTPAELWIGADGLLRRMRMTSNLPAEGGHASGTMVMDYSLHDFGARLDTTAPPASDTDEATDALRGALKGLTPAAR